ncbi:DUF4212 domain-containing protein [Burkholderia sp. Ac-20379]|uniref:DUF4212 domain-containing protein n=1 Tax=Burkholderia sp. Ac-20379 TaxID=2703900 RepID=UPI00197D4E06|nr:DUF4212 domain-containing protein [Burkholderia sp. Ac-20379]MBN3723951.1 DUF4212 domain-containing protein [Burkholderia sp. Ac-20379]
MSAASRPPSSRSSTPSSTASHRTEPPPVPARLARAHARYWRFNLILIAVLMAIGFGVSFVVPFFAPALAGLRFAGFSLPFYLGAQGAILIYLLLIAVYVLLMQRADRTLRRDYAAFDAGQGGEPEPAQSDRTNDAHDSPTGTPGRPC